jgi:hypothetical protein
MGEGLPYFQRFIFYINEKGIQDVRGPGRKRIVKIGLRDLSAKLRKTDESRDWTSPAVFTYSVVCDKTMPEKSLVHCIANRAGVEVNNVDCATIPVTLPYVQIRYNTWAELSSLARAYRCHLECAPEKPLVFAHSPYQVEPLADDETSYTFTGEDIFYLNVHEMEGRYRNTVRLKINLPVSLNRQEIWRYEDNPVLYDELLKAYYPFKNNLIRDIEQSGYEAKYHIKDSNGKERPVIYSDQIDTKEEAENRLDYDGGPFEYSEYDVTSSHDKAVIKLNKMNDGNLYRASIHGRPIVLDLNRSCFIRDKEEIIWNGTRALNVTGRYFSEQLIDGRPQYEDWVDRELRERMENQRTYLIKTHKALFHARVGAKVQIQTKTGTEEGKIVSFWFRYRKKKAFTASFRINK